MRAERDRAALRPLPAMPYGWPISICAPLARAAWCRLKPACTRCRPTMIRPQQRVQLRVTGETVTADSRTSCPSTAALTMTKRVNPVLR